MTRNHNVSCHNYCEEVGKREEKINYPSRKMELM